MTEASYEQANNSLRDIVAGDIIAPGFSLIAVLPFPIFLLSLGATVLPLSLLGKWAEVAGVLDRNVRISGAQALLVHASFVALTGLLWAIVGLFRGGAGQYFVDGAVAGVVTVAIFAAGFAAWRRMNSFV